MNKVLRVYVSSDGQASNPGTVAVTQVGAATGKTMVGRAKDSGAASNFWIGQIFHPTVLPGAASAAHLSSLGANFVAPSAL